MRNLTLSTVLTSALLISAPLLSLNVFAQTEMGDMSGDMAGDKMQPQGGDAPKNARDPHAYANGTTLTQGPYALADGERLTLADEYKFYAILEILCYVFL